MKEEDKDLNYWKENARDSYMATPICVLRYIGELEKNVKPRRKNTYTLRRLLIGFLFGFGIGIGSLFILIASLIEGHNLILELLDRMEEFWKERDINDK